ncbi:MAG: hypothetical protein R3296_14725 [Oleiphilaceae bacterium]|nr:hypothetical protein [Oleiphilaceae bacterium]
MIRWLCYGLLLANGLVFWLAAQTPAPKQETLAHANLPRVSTLQLVGESSPPSEPTSNGGERPLTDCYVASGFASPEDARLWRDSQSLTETQARPRSLTVAMPPYYWVLIPPQDSREEALARLAQLQQKGIDSYLIDQGEQRWGISLGLFEASDRARALLQRRRNAGIEDAVLSQRPRSRELYALEGDSALQSAVRAGQLKPNGLALSLRACEGVAKADKSP